MIEAEIVADSVNPDGDRITSFLLTYPRFIHSELMTHRAFSRNSASSRAIPLKTMIDAVTTNPAMPVYWAKNQRGMQASEEINSKITARDFWNVCLLSATTGAIELHRRFDLHKAICNRVIEPFAHMTTLVTATDYKNFFALRAHPDAQQEFQVLAYRMLGLYLSNWPKKKEWDDWHLPYHNPELDRYDTDIQLKVCVARACRTSYTKFFGDFNVEDDCALHDAALSKKHMSVFEHPAQARVGRWANFTGWQSYRYMIPGENQIDVDLESIYRNRPEWVDGAGL